MKATMNKEEWWPVYSLDADISYVSDYTPLVDVSKELWDEYIEVFKRFDAIQGKLSELYNEHGK